MPHTLQHGNASPHGEHARYIPIKLLHPQAKVIRHPEILQPASEGPCEPKAQAVQVGAACPSSALPCGAVELPRQQRRPSFFHYQTSERPLELVATTPAQHGSRPVMFDISNQRKLSSKNSTRRLFPRNLAAFCSSRAYLAVPSLVVVIYHVADSDVSAIREFWEHSRRRGTAGPPTVLKWGSPTGQEQLGAVAWKPPLLSPCQNLPHHQSQVKHRPMHLQRCGIPSHWRAQQA
jgi:hypothetical protein